MSSIQCTSDCEFCNPGAAWPKVMNAPAGSYIAGSRALDPFKVEIITPMPAYTELWNKHNKLAATYDALVTANTKEYNNNKALTAENKRLSALLTDTKAKNGYLDKQIGEQKRFFGLSILHITDFQEQVAELKELNDTVRQAYEEREEKVTSLQKSNTDLEDECEMLKGKWSGLRERKSKDMATLRAEIAGLRTENDTFQSDFDRLRGEFARRCDEIQWLKGQTLADFQTTSRVQGELKYQRDSVKGLEEQVSLQEDTIRHLMRQVLFYESVYMYESLSLEEGEDDGDDDEDDDESGNYEKDEDEEEEEEGEEDNDDTIAAAADVTTHEQETPSNIEPSTSPSEEVSQWEAQWVQVTPTPEVQVRIGSPMNPKVKTRHLEKIISFQRREINQLNNILTIRENATRHGRHRRSQQTIFSQQQEEIERLGRIVSAHMGTITDLESQKVALLEDAYQARHNAHRACELESQIQVERYVAQQAELENMQAKADECLAQTARNDRLKAQNEAQLEKIRRLRRQLVHRDEEVAWANLM